MTRTVGFVLSLTIALFIGFLLGSANGGLYMVAGVGNDNYAVINRLTGATWLCMGVTACGQPTFVNEEDLPASYRKLSAEDRRTLDRINSSQPTEGGSGEPKHPCKAGDTWCDPKTGYYFSDESEGKAGRE